MIRNSSTSYGWGTIVLHWVMALSIFGMFGLGLYMVDLTYYDTWYKGSLDLHKSIGMTLLGIWALRLYWNMSGVKPQALPGIRWEQQAAKLMHHALYLVMFLLFFCGYLISTADGRAIEVFTILSVPALPWTIENQEDIAGEVHTYLAWLLIGMSAIHALAAIKHQLLNKNDGLMRIFRVTR